MSLSLVTPPASYPVTLDEAKLQCRVDGDDAKLTALIAAATDYVQLYTGRAIVSQTWNLVLDDFSDVMLIPKGPVQSITAITYVDEAGATQTLSTDVYTADLFSDPAWIVLNDGQSRPAVKGGVNMVQIRFVAGYSTVPESLKHAILLLISLWYDNRADAVAKQMSAVPHAVDALLANHRSFAA